MLYMRITSGRDDDHFRDDVHWGGQPAEECRTSGLLKVAWVSKNWSYQTMASPFSTVNGATFAGCGGEAQNQLTSLCNQGGVASTCTCCKKIQSGSDM
eukprot:5905590-Amphidinium_carterae.1